MGKNTTTLLYCEWDDECECAKHFRSLCWRWCGKKIYIKNWYGWSPLEIVRKAIVNGEWYDEIYVWIDSDRPETTAALKLAKAKWIIVISNSPNFESDFLKFLGEKPKHVSIKSQLAKKLWKTRLNNPATYHRFFPDLQSIPKNFTPFSSLLKVMK